MSLLLLFQTSTPPAAGLIVTTGLQAQIAQTDTPGPGAVIVTGFSPLLGFGVTFTAGVGSVAFGGLQSGIALQFLLVPASGVITVVGNSQASLYLDKPGMTMQLAAAMPGQSPTTLAAGSRQVAQTLTGRVS